MRIAYLCLLFIIIGCANEKSIMEEKDIELEKKEIIKVLNNETKAAFSRDYEQWKTYWVQEDFISKTYINHKDSTFLETLGWGEINSFVKNYIEDHPIPEPFPELLSNIDVRFYGTGAWVSYTQSLEGQGYKRETRLMEKVSGQWKIAGMHTSIYPKEN